MRLGTHERSTATYELRHKVEEISDVYGALSKLSEMDITAVHQFVRLCPGAQLGPMAVLCVQHLEIVSV